MMYRVLGIALLSLAICAASSAQAQEPASAAADKVETKAAPAKEAAKPASSKPAKTAAEPAKKGGPDRLDLDKTVVTGNRELPKVLYIVPWKKSEIGDLPAQPFNTLLDEALAPVDRDVFKRELRYYDALQGGGEKTAAPAAQGEK